MDSCKEKPKNKSDVVETDVIIFPVNEFNTDEGIDKITDRTSKKSKLLKENFAPLKPQTDII